MLDVSVLESRFYPVRRAYRELPTTAFKPALTTVVTSHPVSTAAKIVDAMTMTGTNGSILPQPSSI